MDMIEEAKADARQRREAHNADRSITIYLERVDANIIWRWKVYGFFHRTGPSGSSRQEFIHRTDADQYFNEMVRKYKLTEVGD